MVRSGSRGTLYMRTGFSPRGAGAYHTDGAEGVWWVRRMEEGLCLWCVGPHCAVRACIIMPGMVMTTIVMCLGPVRLGLFLRLLPRTFGLDLCCADDHQLSPRQRQQYYCSAGCIPMWGASRKLHIHRVCGYADRPFQTRSGECQ